MDLAFTDEQLELHRTINDILSKECPTELVRAITEGRATPTELWATQVELDWPALALPTAVGGLGYTAVELTLLAEALGYNVAPGPCLATVTQFAPIVAEVATAAQRDRWLGSTARGELTGTLAIDEGTGTWDLDVVEATAVTDGDELVLAGTKCYVVDGTTADEVACVVRIDGELRVVVVPGAGLAAEALTPIDATTPHATVVLDGVRVGRDRLLGSGDGASGIGRALDQAFVAVGASTLGACQRIFEMTDAYAKERVQFDVPIGSFQAVKHKLADMYRDVERARALVYYAALTIAEDDAARTLAAAMAKAGAGECQQRCVQDGLQLFGGIGYTWQHDLHLFLRRAKVGELHFGTSSHHRRRIARLTLATA